MYIRKLEEKDAYLMYDWMHDPNVVSCMSADFMSKTLADCQKFIAEANADEVTAINRAVCTDEDEYLGTVSLKNISYEDSNAEYAIVLSSKAMGTGAAMFATKEILRVAFEELGLHKVYLYVKSGNLRARKFYDKVGFRKEGEFIDHIKEKEGTFETLFWLAMLEDEYKR